ncbi:MAG: ATP-binding protein [Chryseolinea sp.]
MTDLIEELRAVPEFKELPPNQLEWLADKGTVVAYSDGDMVFKKGDVIDHLRILLKGEVHYYIQQAGSQRHLGRVERYEITGQLPFSRLKSAAGSGVVKGDALVFSLHKNYFLEMIQNHYELVEVLVHVMTDRVRDFTKQQQQDEKMMALGKLSAGLAHELNNPSAAVVRSAHELKRHLSNETDNFKRLIRIQATDEGVDKVQSMLVSWIAKSKGLSFTLMEKTSLEDDLNDWMGENDIEINEELAETFAQFGIGPSELESIKALLRPQDVIPIIQWIYKILTTEQLVGEIEEAAKRINALVTSVKGYTHMDQTPEKELGDIHIGIRNTLTMLNHKFKKNSITLTENYQMGLPQAMIYVSPINQVWTNLIDNALDALEGTPGSKLEIKTERKNEFIQVSIIDNGPGIATDIIDKIFDPFFTTKAIGKGTGLGLEVVRQIVNQHQGKIEVTSTPGRTCFMVCLPLGQDER